MSSTKIGTKIKEFLASNWFLWTVIALFASETIWLAVNSKFQMAFDEAHHFGMIQFFAHHPSPYVSHQAASTYNLGPLSHNPSILYYILLGLPYKLLTFISSSLRFDVIGLRFINIGLAIANLLVIKKLLTLIKIPNLVSNLTILAFAFTPIVSVLSAQINYDNLVILLASLSTYEVIRFIKQLKGGKFNLRLLLSITCLALFGSMVKYSFVAITLCILALISLTSIAYLKRQKTPIGQQLINAYSEEKWVNICLSVAVIIGMISFIAFYGVNIIKFHNPVPACEQVLSTGACSNYYPWARNHSLAVNKVVGQTTMTLPAYILLWLREMYYQIFAEIIPTGGLVPIERNFRLIVYGLSAIGGICLLISFRKIFSKSTTRIMSLITASYLLALLARNYHDYLNLGQAVAIQGRFLLPVLIYIYILLAYGYYYAFSKTNGRVVNKIIAPAVIGVVVSSFMYWGGYMQYIQKVSPSFRWSKFAELKPAEQH